MPWFRPHLVFQKAAGYPWGSYDPTPVWEGFLGSATRWKKSSGSCPKDGTKVDSPFLLLRVNRHCTAEDSEPILCAHGMPLELLSECFPIEFRTKDVARSWISSAVPRTFLFRSIGDRVLFPLVEETAL